MPKRFFHIHLHARTFSFSPLARTGLRAIVACQALCIVSFSATLVCAAPQGTVAAMNVPDAENSVVPRLVPVVGTHWEDGTLVPHPDFRNGTAVRETVIVRDFVNNPILASLVRLDFSDMIDIELCRANGDVLGTLPFVNDTCSTSQLWGFTNNDGVLVFSVLGRSVNDSLCADGHNMIHRGTVYADGVIIGHFTSPALLQNSDNVHDSSDVKAVEHDVACYQAKGTYVGRSDFDGDGVLDAQDVSAANHELDVSRAGGGSDLGCHDGLSPRGYCPHAIPNYRLWVSVSGAGTVAKDPDYAEYPHGTVVELTAVAESGWEFIEWGGDASGGTNPLSVTMNGDKTIEAVFGLAHASVSIGDTATLEGGPGNTTCVFTVTRGGDTTLPVTVYYATADGSATSTDNDYVAASSSVVIPAFVSSGTIAVEVVGDTTYEANEVFYVRLTGADNASVEDALGVGTILNDDTRAALRNSYVTDGSVHEAVLSPEGDLLYIGGSFRQVGAMMGNWVAIDGTSGEAMGQPSMVAGGYGVYAAAADGQGGWYIGGDFGAVMGVRRQGLAHILAGGGLSEWNPGANDVVYTLAVVGSTIYVGGNFTTIGGQPRNRIAALDATTGAATDWNPNADRPVWSLANSGSTIYAGGNFAEIGGHARNNIAALDAVTGGATDWNPNPDDRVETLLISGSTVYAGGLFTTIGGQPRNHIAALDAATGAATDWNPNADWSVEALAVNGSTVYVGGGFTTIGGQPRNHIAALDAATGTATNWDPNADGGYVSALAVSGSTVYAGGGGFSSIGGQPRNYIAALDASSGAASVWNPSANGTVFTLAVSGSTIYAGGSFTSIGVQTRRDIAALDATTGIPTDWDPNPDGDVRALAVSGSTVYVGGYFSAIGGRTRSRIAALDAATGTATDWDPNASSTVHVLIVAGSTIYAGGGFTTIGGQTRNRIAALDVATGAATAWNPNADDYVLDLAVSGSTVYAGGLFTTISGQTRNHIAALDAATGIPTAWTADANDIVRALGVSGSTVYAGGSFTMIGGQMRNHIAALDATTGTPTSWDPNVSDDSTGIVTVQALEVCGSAVYVGGSFTRIGGLTRNHIAALDAATGEATDWDPNVDGPPGTGIFALAVGDETIYVGGRFRLVGDHAQSNVAAIAAPVDIDLDGVQNADDNCPTTANAMQTDLDADGVGDLCDLCPSDPLDDCDPSGSVAAEILAGSGGSLSTVDHALTIEIDPGDLAGDTTIAVTQVSGPKDRKIVDILLGPSTGTGLAVAQYDLEPDGLVFDGPVRVSIIQDVSYLNQALRERLNIFVFDEGVGRFVEVPTVCSIVEESAGVFIATCTADVEHFSVHGLIAPLDAVPGHGAWGLVALILALAAIALVVLRGQPHREEAT